jgi:uncharacterized protein involved in exopolysaccharide biosynthesis
MKKTPTHIVKKDEISLRELFRTIGRYKWSIIFFTILITLAVAVKVYFMPKYYKSTVTIEVKPEEQDAGGFSMGGAAAMLLGGGGSSTNLEKDITLLKTYRTNKKVLGKVHNYMVRYFSINSENHKLEEINIDNNLSIEVTDVTINDFKDYGMRLLVEPIDQTQYRLSFPGTFSNKPIGLYHYSEMVKHEKFRLMVHKKRAYKKAYTLQLSGTKRYIFEKIITPNLKIEADKKSPFITISYLDNLPQRGEEYLKNLLEIYTKQSITDIKNDASLMIDSYNKQLQKIEKRVISSSQKLENYKVKNSIMAPELQAGALVKELSKVGIEIAQNNYKQDLIKNLIVFAKQNQNIDAIAPSLIELQDQPTIALIKLIQEQQIALSELLLKYKPTHPTVVRADQTIFNLKSKVLSNLENLQKTLKNKTHSLRLMEQGYNKKLKSAPKQEQKLIGFSRNYKVNEKMYIYLMQERSVSEIKRDKALSRFKVIESIYTSDKAAKPKKVLIVIVTFILTFILMIFIAFFREFLKGGKKDE